MANYKNITESGVITSRPGKLGGFIVATHSSGTAKFYDGTEAGANAVGKFTSSGAIVSATHATSKITSAGASVAATHATGTLTVSGGVNFKDAVAASGVLTSDGTNPTAGETVTVDTTVFTFRAAADMNDPTDVLIGATAAATMLNLLAKLGQVPTITAALTSTYVITVTAKTPGTSGNSIAKAEDSSHLDWDGVGAALTGGLAAETVTIGTTVYTFTDGPCDVAYKVKIGSTPTASLLNLKNAINANYSAGGFSLSTPKHTQVVAYSSNATTCVIYANVVGASLNALATTETCAAAAWGGTTLVDGVATTSSTVTIGSTVYTQVNVLSETLGAPAVANQFLRGASEATMLDALKAAINGTSVGTLCSTGTVAHPDVIATTNADDAQTIVARWVGDDDETTRINAIATTCTMANTAWADTTLGGGTGDSNPAVTTSASTFTIGTRTYTFVTELSETSGADPVADQILYVTSVAVALDNMKKAINASGIAGTDYSTGTTQNTQVVATTNANDSQIIQALITGTEGNDIATSTTIVDHAWGAKTLASGTGATGKVLIGTITFPAVTTGPLTYNFPEALSFQNGLYVEIGGTSADITVEYN
jgi:hypothetical protein